MDVEDSDKAWRQWRMRPRARATKAALQASESVEQLPARISVAPSATSQQMYDRMMKEVVAPALRDFGFSGSAGRFELKTDAATWRLLGFQKSVYSDRDEVRFTLNLSTISKATWAEQSKSRVLAAKPSMTIFYGEWARQTRITDLLPDKDVGEKWWRVIAGDAIEPIAADVLSDIELYALPWLRH
jgi:hypothetical protein